MTTMKRDVFQIASIVAAIGVSSCAGQSDGGTATSDGEPSGTEAGTGSDPPNTESPGTESPPVDSAAPGTSPDGSADDDVAQPQEPTADATSCDIASSPCGGDVVGRWNVVDCPLELSGEIDVLGFGLGCPSARVVSGTLRVSGTWIVDASGELTDDTTTTGTQQFELSEDCISVGVLCDDVRRPFENALGYDTVDCVTNPETLGCTCVGTFEQQGGLAAISLSPLLVGSYSVADATLTSSDAGDETSYQYCVMDDAMVLTLPMPSKVGQVEGSIVLQKE